MIHHTAIISDKATIAEGVTIGPYCVIGDNVKIGTGCVLRSHVVIDSSTKIGENNEFFPFAAIGQKTQDLKYDGEPTYLKIGNNNVFRENTTVHRSTNADTPTTIGDHNLFLCYSHVAHDCIVKNHTIFSNNATIAGHVIVNDYAIISGLSAVHQFCQIGEHSIIGGCTKIVQDVPPFMIIDGAPASVRGINAVGMERRSFPKEDINALKTAYKKLFLKKDRNLGNAIKEFEENQAADNTSVKKLIGFLKQSERGVIK